MTDFPPTQPAETYLPRQCALLWGVWALWLVSLSALLWYSALHQGSWLTLGLLAALGAVSAVLWRSQWQQHHLRRQLAEVQTFHNAMENTLVTGLRVRDLQGRITYVNPAFCAMVGFAPQALLHQDGPPPYWPPDLVQQYQEELHQRLHQPWSHPDHSHRSKGIEAWYQHRDGRRFPVLIFEAPLVNHRGQHRGWMSTVIDISEPRRMQELSRATQERLQAAARLASVGEMASLLSHELNQPLAAISSYATGALNLLNLPPEIEPKDDVPRLRQQLQDMHSAMQCIVTQTERAGRIVQGVRHLLHRRSQADHCEREPIPVQALMEAIVPMMELQAQSMNARLQIDIAPHLPALLCERTMVEQVLLNLTRNGLQAMRDTAPAQRLLQVCIRPSHSAPTWLEFEITDHGCGIAPEIAPQLFTAFFTTREQGMGLGLNLCRTVIEQHGGTLTFGPHSPQGTVFVFTLPTAPPV